jgi:hypothetical protein
MNKINHLGRADRVWDPREGERGQYYTFALKLYYFTYIYPKKHPK